MTWALIAVGSYLIGSIPFGLLVTRWVAGVDLRTVGSGNIGATNASRAVGKTWGIIVLLFDALKGLLPTTFAPVVFAVEPTQALHASVLAGVCAILGHTFPVWLRFRGGKGVATALGVAVVLSPWGTLTAFVAFVVVMLTVRIVSLGSIVAAVAFATYQHFAMQPDPWSASTWSLATFSVAIPALIVFRHRENIRRLIRGEEARWKPRKDAAKDAQG
ncbi:MAG TPA: glycerol-3-phosphate 1-O-acyltransferase PlsY [Planctomycetaceae bacterium]|nr:glycerol-3-phosphate 1-O-acyltransferase PlsY [Planctomycetaceae bacterium]